MINITFYHYSGERNRMNKTLGDGVEIPSNFNMEYNKINPTIRMALPENFDYNYCYIPELKRYYFIDRVTIRRGGFYDIYLTLDVLQTYHDEILAMTGTITESQTADYMQGANIPVYAKTTTKSYQFEDKFNHAGTYVMIATGNIEDKKGV